MKDTPKLGCVQHDCARCRAHGWISVEERLPRDDPHRAYLVVYKNAIHRSSGEGRPAKRNVRVIRIAIYSGGAWRFISHSDKTRLSERVTHWQPKPRLPRAARAHSPLQNSQT